MCVLITTGRAEAQSSEPAASAEPVEVPPAEAVESTTRVGAGQVWTWRQHHWLDYAAAAAFGAVAVGDRLADEDVSVSWRGGFGLDEPARDAMRLRRESDRTALKRLSDVSLVLLVAYPVLVDAAAVAGAGRGWGEAAWHMFLIDAQAFAFSNAFTGLVKRFTSRERPVYTQCRDEPEYDSECDVPHSPRSFISGHASIAFTGAGLTCIHHAYLPLYGGDYDALTCVTAVTLATTVGIERMASDVHYLSDVAAGAAVGLASGMLFPWLSFYSQPRLGEPQDARWMVVPSSGGEGFGASLLVSH